MQDFSLGLHSVTMAPSSEVTMHHPSLETLWLPQSQPEKVSQKINPEGPIYCREHSQKRQVTDAGYKLGTWRLSGLLAVQPCAFLVFCLAGSTAFNEQFEIAEGNRLLGLSFQQLFTSELISGYSLGNLLVHPNSTVIARITAHR